MAVYTHCHIVQILDVACQCWPVPLLQRSRCGRFFLKQKTALWFGVMSLTTQDSYMSLIDLLTMWQIVTLCYLHSSTIDSLGIVCRPTRSVEVVLRDWRPWLGQWRAASLHRWSQQCLGFRWSSTHPGQATIFGTAELHIFPADDQRKSGLAIRSHWSPATAPIRSWYLGSCLDAANKQ